jgi:hypothetical protein
MQRSEPSVHPLPATAEALKAPPLVVVRDGDTYEVRDGSHVLAWAATATAAATEARTHARRFRRGSVLFLEDGRLEHLESDD